MMEAKPVRRALQARSLETMNRFLDATEELLQEKKFHEINVMEIIERSGRTVGSFYARFDDKYAVLRCLRERSTEHAKEQLDRWTSAERFAGASAEKVVEALVRVTAGTYREMGPVFRATAAQAAVDDDFRDHRQEIFQLVAARYVELLGPHRHRIGAPDPDRAIDLGFTLIIGIFDQRMLFGRLGLTSVDDQQLTDELIALVLGLLQLDSR